MCALTTLFHDFKSFALYWSTLTECVLCLSQLLPADRRTLHFFLRLLRTTTTRTTNVQDFAQQTFWKHCSYLRHVGDVSCFLLRLAKLYIVWQAGRGNTVNLFLKINKWCHECKSSSHSLCVQINSSFKHWGGGKKQVACSAFLLIPHKDQL